MFNVNYEGTRTTPLASFSCLYCELRRIFTHCPGVSTAHFEKVNAVWDSTTKTVDCDVINMNSYLVFHFKKNFMSKKLKIDFELLGCVAFYVCLKMPNSNFLQKITFMTRKL